MRGERFARACSTPLLVSSPWLPLKKEQLFLIPHVILQGSFPVLWKPFTVQQLWAKRNRLTKSPLRGSSPNLKRLLHGEKIQLSYSLQALGGKELQASCLPLFWTCKTADRCVSSELKNWLYRRSKNMWKTGKSLILGKWVHLIAVHYVMLSSQKASQLNSPPVPEFTSFPTIPVVPECPQRKGGSAQKDLGCHPSACCPETFWLYSTPPGYLFLSLAATRILTFIIQKRP